MTMPGMERAGRSAHAGRYSFGTLVDLLYLIEHPDKNRDRGAAPRRRAMFITNSWYMGAWSSELGETPPLRRIIMEQPIVMFRCSDGSVAALEDRCPHRNFPLSKGVFANDTLQCGYHGLTFDRSGVCVYAPGQNRAPPGARIRSYPFIERYGVAWIWMGERAIPDPNTIPDLSWMDQPGWSSYAGGYIHLNAPDQSLVENLLDISHLAFVHKNSMGSDPDLIAQGKITVTIDSCGVRRLVDFDAIPTPPLYSKSALVGDRVDQRTESRMQPGLYQNDAVIKPTGSGDWTGPGSDGDYPIRERSLHAVVPETARTTHYFVGGASKDADVPIIDRATGMAIFREDVEVLELIEDNMRFFADRPVINLRNDLAVMRWRAFRNSVLGLAARDPRPADVAERTLSRALPEGAL
jgi:vanillate O-demethylase monooxygenase subunit